MGARFEGKQVAHQFVGLGERQVRGKSLAGKEAVGEGGEGGKHLGMGGGYAFDSLIEDALPGFVRLLIRSRR